MKPTQKPAQKAPVVRHGPPRHQMTHAQKLLFVGAPRRLRRELSAIAWKFHPSNPARQFFVMP